MAAATETRFQLIVIDVERYLARGRLRGTNAALRTREIVRERTPLAHFVARVPWELDRELRFAFGRDTTVTGGALENVAISHIRSRGEECVTCALLSVVTDRQVETGALSRFAEKVEVVSLDQPLAVSVLPIQPRLMTIHLRFIEKWMRIDQTDYAGRQGVTFLVTARTERGRRGFIDSVERQGWIEKTNMTGWRRQAFKPTYMVAEHSARR